ncbi:ribonuclease J [Thermaerobacillus caldiproteolyticus]|uniref:Ribonuclease J n=1 Tax=Thermaerobacillus caldiproteolyticus TaxID=247480 RepID=A0A7V9Z9K5_9BACL|nr:ribonuclease J [Anoxybacillus caldiproteolyticus]MBA2876547.1 ribonuclease J [Anoxybacillus caldiproteolyticus]QPA32104.1 ribonuclease J [Anoxybacillus caldiproteolyticus]
MRTKQVEKIRVFSLGGVGEIGKNMYVVEIDDDIFVIDAGVMFPEDEMLGIDKVIPDITYLVERQERIKAIFLTHGHEEHIGAIAYVLKKITAPVYGTKLTLGLAEEKLREHGVTSSAPFVEIRSDSEVVFEKAKVTFFRTIHSIPDSVGISIHTSQGAIVYTSDFKFDQTPYGMNRVDLGKMARIGEQGVLCLLSDSTNAEKPGYTGSDTLVAQEIADVVYNAEGRVIVACYASNITRIQQVLHAAKASGRKVAIVGKSMHKVMDIAVRLGYLYLPDKLTISIHDIERYEDRELLILTTGGHGEPMGALARMAKQAHKQINIKEGDTVIVAASVMPGYELLFSKTIDALYRAGANVVYGQRKVHVSGHGCQEELKLMLNLMKPKYFIPVHGEYRMQKAHANLAKAVGISEERTFLIDKGDVIEFRNGQARSGGKVPYGNILIDGLGIGDVGNIVLRDRRLLSQDGILIVVVTLSKEAKKIIAGPEIISRGFVYVRESETLLDEATKMVTNIVNQCMQDYIIEWSSLKLNIREALNQFLFEKTKRKPMILPIIMEI